MWRREKNLEGARRTADRRQRENDAPRLLDETPTLQSLFIELKESNEPFGDQSCVHIRRFVLETSPALFVFPCGDPKCNGGGHDVTAQILDGLRARRTRTEGEDRCAGAVGEIACARKLHYAAVAAFA